METYIIPNQKAYTNLAQISCQQQIQNFGESTEQEFLNYFVCPYL